MAVPRVGDFYIQRSNQDFWLRELVSGVPTWVRKGNIRDEGASGIISITPVVALGFNMGVQVTRTTFLQSAAQDLGLDFEVILTRVSRVAASMDVGIQMSAILDLVETGATESIAASMALGFDQSTSLVTRTRLISASFAVGSDQAAALRRTTLLQANSAMGFSQATTLLVRTTLLTISMAQGFSQATTLRRTTLLTAAMAEGFSQATALRRTTRLTASMAEGFSQAATLLVRTTRLTVPMAEGFLQASALRRTTLLTPAMAEGFSQASPLTHVAPIPGFLVIGSGTTPFMTVYDSTLTKVTKTWTTPAGNISSVAISPNKQFIAVGMNASPFLQIYDCTTGVPVLVTSGVSGFSTVTDVPSGLEFTKDGTKLLVTWALTPFIRLFDTASWTTTGSVPTLSAGPSMISMHPDGTRYMLGFNASPFVREYTLSTGVTTGNFEALTSFPRGMGYSRLDSATDYLATLETGPTLRFYNAASPGSPLTNPGSPTAGNPNFAQRTLNFNSDGSRLLIAGSGVGGGGTEYKIISRSGTTLTTVNLGTVPTEPIRTGVWSRDGTKLIALVTGGSGNFMYSYNASTLVKDTTNANQPPGSFSACDCSW